MALGSIVSGPGVKAERRAGVWLKQSCLALGSEEKEREEGGEER